MPKTFLDEIIRFSIHEHEFNQLAKTKKALVEDYRDLEFYKDGLKCGKDFDRVVECKRLIKDYVKAIKKNKGKESNEECMIIGQLLELMDRMMAADIRKLQLEKLL